MNIFGISSPRDTNHVVSQLKPTPVKRRLSDTMIVILVKPDVEVINVSCMYIVGAYRRTRDIEGQSVESVDDTSIPVAKTTLKKPFGYEKPT